MANKLRIGGLAAVVNGEYYHVHSIKKYPGAVLHVWTGTEYRPLTEREKEWVSNGGILKICKRCGELMCASHTAQHYCQECKDLISKEREHPPVIKSCKWCGKQFVAKHSKQICCSDECEKANSSAECRKRAPRYKTVSKPRDPYAWLHAIDEHLKANDGKYYIKNR